MYKIYTKIWLIMRITTLIILAACMQLSAASFAQKVTLSERQTSLKSVLKKLRLQSGYDFVYTDVQLQKAKPVSIQASHAELEDVLAEIFDGQPLSFTIQDKTVVVKEKQKGILDRLRSIIETNEKEDLNTQLITSQQIITGRVTDSLGHPLQNATVKVKGTNRATFTDRDGHFTLQNVDESITLQISYLGYRSKEIKASSDVGTIVLFADQTALEEAEVVLSTGYQQIPKERATGSFVQPIKEMFEARVSTDLISKLSGITSGLVFNANTFNAQSTGKFDVSIRGRNTIYANDQPLIVVDNFPYSGDISDLNPNDYDEPTILRDAASASIWGVRAGNGVIVFTSKKGRAEQPLKVAFNTNLTLSDKPDLNYNPNQLNASSYIDLEKYLYSNGFYDSSLDDTYSYPAISPVVELLEANPADLEVQLDRLRTYNVNDQLNQYFYQKAVNQQYALNLSGGSDKTTFYLSAGYDKNIPVQKENAYQRITLNSQNTFYPIKNLELYAGINVIQGINIGGNNLQTISNNLFPYTRFADDDGNPLPITYGYRDSYLQSAAGKGFLDWTYTPLKELGSTDNTTKNLDVRLNTGVKYIFMKGLSGEIRYQYQRNNILNKIYNSQDTYYTRNWINMFSIVTDDKVTGYNVPLGGILNQGNTNTVAHNLRGQLNFDRSFGDHEITALAGYELSQTVGESNSSLLYGYNDELATFTNVDPVNSYETNPTGGYAQINNGLSITGTLVRIRSVFANASYSYKGRYDLTGSARMDGTNYFGVATNQKNVPLWSVGAKWDLSKEAYYHLSWLPSLSVRGSYGYNGNMDHSVTGMTTLYYISNATYTGFNWALVSNYGNPDLRWEKTGITNIAADFATRNNLISGSIEYYIKHQKDLLGDQTMPSSSGVTSMRGNYSDMQGNGFDVTLTSANLRGAFKWNTTLLFSHATDKVTKFDIEPYTTTAAASEGYIAIPWVGKPVFGLYGFKWGGLDHDTGSPIGFLDGKESQDYSAIVNNTPLTDLVYAGPARPVYFGGINNRFAYKGFTFSFQISYKLGYYFRKPTINYSLIGSSGNAFLRVNRDINLRWQHPGDEITTNVPALIYPFNASRDQFYQNAEINIEKGDHIRLQDITLSYEFTKSMFHGLPFHSMQVYAYANNLAILWRANKAGLDPDAVMSGMVDRLTTVSPRMVSIGLKAGF